MALEWTDLVATARAQGWREERRTRHILLLAPHGSGTVCIPTSTSDWRSIHNCLAALRRHGLIIGGRRPRAGSDDAGRQSGAEPATTLERFEQALSVEESVYDAVVTAAHPLSATDLSAATGLSRSTIAPALAAMTEEGVLAIVGSKPRAKRGVRPDMVYDLAGRT